LAGVRRLEHPHRKSLRRLLYAAGQLLALDARMGTWWEGNQLLGVSCGTVQCGVGSCHWVSNPAQEVTFQVCPAAWRLPEGSRLTGP
jgi:hypothetical protein